MLEGGPVKKFFRNFSRDLIFALSRDLPLEGEKSARDNEKDFFGRTLKMPLSHSSHYEDTQNRADKPKEREER